MLSRNFTVHDNHKGEATPANWHTEVGHEGIPADNGRTTLAIDEKAGFYSDGLRVKRGRNGSNI
mgnify:FL=1